MARIQPKLIHQLTIAQFERMFLDDGACCAYRVGRRWPEGVPARVAARRSSARKPQSRYRNGGRDRDRTCDPSRVKGVLSR